MSSPEQQQPTNNNSVIVLQLSSYGIRYDWNDLESTEPKTLINCMAIPKHIIHNIAKKESVLANVHHDDQEDDEVVITTSKTPSSSTTKLSFMGSTCEKQVMAMRGKILVDRKVLPENRIETDNYLEPVSMELSSTHPQVYHDQSLCEISDFLVGKEAIDTKKTHPNDFVLYFPVKFGLVNCDLCEHGQVEETIALEIIVNLLSRCIRELIQTSTSSSFSLLIIFSDTFLSQQVEHLKFIVEEILTQFDTIENISVQKDSIMSLYGSGITHQQTELYTVDMGFTKTSIYSYQPNGKLASSIHYPYGGYDVYNLINGILQMSKFNHKIDISTNLNEYDDNVRKYCLTLKSNTHQETVQHLHNIYLEDKKEYASSIAVSTDVFYIASNLYFNTKLLPSPKKKFYNQLNPTQQSKISSMEKYLAKTFKGGTGGVTICLTGGFSCIQFLSEQFKELMKKKRLKILISNERDKLVPAHCTTWKGGVIITHIMNPENYLDDEDDSSTSNKDNLTKKLFFHRSELFRISSQSSHNIPKFVTGSFLLERTL